ncbi:MAG: hypothetical protein A3I73_00460 [Omnitrophica bacterium RIFCSPLOWO2_02_FULL_45_16]|nr:MAG: hypothetical protein A3C51_00395 [Omnitrophica bacterium RIFCSPHIGHO2_02_FULL_46_20]OGW92719.1 MAG: hypothetical protein A3G36_00310 [Omnitrophica bacterium RIFCSPLOWO2_12_FULL_45_13]OGX00029.1 MAG: hypothetical protein A3I73_00460 [Omnitrophica bacterium RIFCSPLOWO2_02_FULL_45_16]
MTKIKICGITNKQDAFNASNLGVDMLGFVFYKKSRRYVEPRVERDIVSGLPPSLIKVGVFVDEDKSKVLDIAEDCELDMLQFHGDEGPGYCDSFRSSYKIIKAFRIKDKSSLKGINDYDVDFYMLDTYSEESNGGTGKSFDWRIIEDFEFLKPVILSGGLAPENVAHAMQKFRSLTFAESPPYGVDVSSGVEEAPGKKDLGLMRKFVENIRKG